MAKLVAYCRVSTDWQVQHGGGLEDQRAAIEQWVAANGHDVVAWFIETGVSGANGLDTREALPDALAALEAGVAEGLVIPKLDRLARDLTVQEVTLRALWTMGATVYAVDQGEIPEDDPDDPMRTAFRQMTGVFAQLEKGMIRARLRTGRRRKAAEGRYIGGFATRYGWRIEDGVWVADDEQQAVIARCVALRDAGSSLRSIAAILNADGVPSPSGGQWYAPAVQRALARAVN
jgi:DNA invertase Pin-like site-specific DNA recombinase